MRSSLNPEIEHILAYAYRRSVALSAWNGANLNHVKEPVLEALARYKFRGITCSIDGITNETYAAYRRTGNVERVFENIRKINANKRRWKTRYPKLRWQMIAFGHNAHEVAPARVLAAELGMEFFLKASWDPNYSPVEAQGPTAPTAVATAPEPCVNTRCRLTQVCCGIAFADSSRADSITGVSLPPIWYRSMSTSLNA